jgi:immunity protein 5 of polymorphic toxin system
MELPSAGRWLSGQARMTLKGRFDAGTTLRWRTQPGPSGSEGWTDTGRGSAQQMILPKVRDPRLVTIRRGGTLADSDHHLLALWAASCAEHVLHLFESAQPDDPRPREAIEHARAWVRGEVTMMQARAAGGHAMGAARNLRGAARHAAYAAGQAGAVAHVAAHELGAAAYAIKAARASAPEGDGEAAGRLECRWQRDQLPEAIRELVLDDQRLRNDICWSAFDC